MNVTAFSPKFCQHDIVPWCSHSQHLDLICALLHNSLQESLGSNSANSSANEKSHPQHCLQTWALDVQQAAFSEHGAEPPILAKLYGNSAHFQTLLDLRGNAWFLCVTVNPDRQQGKKQGTCWKPSCCFWAWIFQVNKFQNVFHR